MPRNLSSSGLLRKALTVVFAALLGYAAARYLLDLSLVSSLVVGTALSATSLGVSIGAWEEAGRVDSPLGIQLIDIAELDDLSAVALMVLFFSAFPVVTNGDGQLLGEVLASTGLWMLAKACLFASFCLVFARWIERPLTGFFERFRHGPDPALAVAGTAFLIASLAGWLGFSIAVGALFAGLAYSRDPSMVKLEASFSTVYDLFTPFFFISIGLALDPAALTFSLIWGSVLLVAAVVGKVVGTAVPVWIADGPRPAILMSISMVPRAEIALFVTSAVRFAVPEAVPDALYGAIVFVCAVTCLVPPVLIRFLMDRWSTEPFLEVAEETRADA